jgi:plastocyanin
MIRRLSALSAAIVATAFLTACGSSSSSSPAGSTQSGSSDTATAASRPSSSPARSDAAVGSQLSFAADPSGELRFTKAPTTANAGRTTIKFTNSASLAHNLTVQQETSGPVLGATPTFAAGTKTLTLELKPGTYTYYCTVPGHRQAGMQGTLTVK